MYSNFYKNKYKKNGPGTNISIYFDIIGMLF